MYPSWTECGDVCPFRTRLSHPWVFDVQSCGEYGDELGLGLFGELWVDRQSFGVGRQTWGEQGALGEGCGDREAVEQWERKGMESAGGGDRVLWKDDDGGVEVSGSFLEVYERKGHAGDADRK